jgi:amidase
VSVPIDPVGGERLALAVRVEVDGRPVRSEMLLGHLGAYLVAISTTLAERQLVTRSPSAAPTGTVTHDLLVTPTVGQLPALHGTLQYEQPDSHHEELAGITLRLRPVHRRVQHLWAAGDQPAARAEPGGLPIGVQIVAPYGREDLLFQIAAQLEQAMPWRDRTPAWFGGRLRGGSPAPAR